MREREDERRQCEMAGQMCEDRPIQLAIAFLAVNT